MALTGDLGSIDLANVFQMLLLSQKTGTLEVRSRGSRTEVYLDGETVLYPFDRDAFPTKVLRRLERAGTVTAEAIAKARASAEVLRRDALAVLVTMKAITEEELDAAIREQMEEETYELFVDREATFEFREGERPIGHGKVVDEHYKLSGNGLIMEAARRLDEWGYIREKVSSDACVFEKGGTLDAIPEGDRDGALLDVFASLDGVRNVAAVIEATWLTRFVVCKKVAFLVDQRVVYEVPVEVLLGRASECLRSQRSREGLALLERAFELGADRPQVHEMAALANHALHRVGEACRHHALVADALERGGDRHGAAEVWLRVRDLLPTDVRCRERLVHHWLDEPEFFADTQYDGASEVTELVQILKEIGRDEDARRMLQETRKRFVADARVTSKYADLSLELGDPRGAVEMLIACADELLTRRQPGVALRLYRRVRSIEPQRDGLDLRIASCERGAHRAPVSAGRLVRMVTGIAVMAALAFAVVAHNRETLQKLAAIDTEEFAVRGDFETALATLDAFRAEHPLTVAAIIAGQRMQELEARAHRHAAELARRAELLGNERGRRQRSADRAYADAQSAIRRGNYAIAVEAMTRAASLAADERWIEREKPAVKAAELTAYLQAARAQSARIEEARARGDWAQVHRLGVLLLRDQPCSPEAQRLELPVRILPEPEDATVETVTPDGARSTSTGPTLLLLPPHATTTVTCTGVDRFPQVVRVVPEAAFELTVRLDRRPDRTFELPYRVLHAPVLANGRAYFACDHGRVVAVDLDTFAVAWQKSLPGLEEVAAPPMLDPEGLRLRTSGGKVVWFDPVDGEVALTQRDVEGPWTAAPVGRKVAAADGGSYVVDEDDRITRRLPDGTPACGWRSPGHVEWGVAMPDGSALFGGGTLLLGVGGPR